MRPVAVCILGMHRSGTSCLAGSLQLAGLYLGQVVESAPFNRKGNRENLDIRELNDAVLNTSGGAWNEPPHAIRWTAAQASRRDELIAQFESEPGRTWGFKDPRTVLTLPFWRERLPDLRFVVTFRHPLAVAHSLAARDGLSLSHGLRLWGTYNRIISSLAEFGDVPTVCFDAPAVDYLAAINIVSRRLSLDALQDATTAQGSFFDETLRHQSTTTAGLQHEIPGDIIETHSRLMDHYQRFRLAHA